MRTHSLAQGTPPGLATQIIEYSDKQKLKAPQAFQSTVLRPECRK